ncbi:hypothetical protein COCMIDRAFT_9942 [Bipolaris oryzae ATCC 44560]|uniref:BZIP domain-containing protein n=1 Tax=Bipolaris oryzae ATCC 44560 TaxID=930090 RepID=W6YR55_COCMI|nr:uncharacterized protein COCMIDRAFT_9942 [Bipolaris oryzae ATCC 44560]EUC40115.1 hypothetical protein COCMIDRAFT_9942 [Bipolaris oryzae ATCC 44560]
MTSRQPPVTRPQLRTRISDNRVTSIGKATDRERIRNNQRRCRARQKEYIATLEDRIRELESDHGESRANKKLEELTAENKSLKQLLQSLGLRDEFLEAYKTAVKIAPNISLPPLDDARCNRASQCLSSSTALESSQLLQVATSENQAEQTIEPFLDVSVSEQESLGFSQMDAPLSWELLDFPTASTSALELVEPDINTERLGQLTMDTLVTEAPSNAITVEHISDTTTLCSWALSLVLRSNMKGYSTADLELMLRVGYRYGATPTEDCRINNKVLLGVLANII